MFVRRTLGCACDGMLDPRGAARPSTESPGGCYVTARHDVATVGESLTGLSERSARHVLVGRGIVKSLKRSGCAAVSRTHKTKSLCDRSGLQTALLVTLTALGVTLTVPSLAQAEQGKCPNEVFRTGRSASLPDCRAYELVTPPELGRTADMTFEFSNDHTAVSSDGEHLALEAYAAFVEPGVSLVGTRTVFSRSPSGWTMRSATTPEIAAEESEIGLLSPDFSQIALVSYKVAESPGSTLDVGPIGGPYSTLSIPPAFRNGTLFVGANAGAPGVAAFSDVLFISPDHALLPPGPEREVAEEAAPERPDLYEWSEGRLRLVNVDNAGKLLNACGAALGSPNGGSGEGAAINAVSADGSRAFFASPAEHGLPGCPEPQLYMRLDGRETVDVSEPEGVSVPPAQRGPVRYDGASADGSKVYFMSLTALTPEAGKGPLLYEYDTEAPVGHRLMLVASEANGIETQVSNPGVVVSEDGSTVYYEGAHEGIAGIYRYDAITGTKSFVAVPSTPAVAGEPWYTTPDGGFLVFPAGFPGVQIAGPHGLPELVDEPRGLGHNELYRYDAADGSVMCVSCGEGAAPARGEMLEPESSNGLLTSPDSSRSPISISEDGRRVFFQTDAQLVPQDTNKTTVEEERERPDELGDGADVYEWEADGTEEVPGVFCGVVNGCTHLISAGEDVGPERFLGASANGDDVFFSSAAQLVPQATPEFTNIYDARVEGGLPPPSPSVECTSCQGVGSPPQQFNTPASETLVGAGNLVASSSTGTKKPPAKCSKGKRLSHGRCVTAKAKRKKTKTAKSNRRGG